MNNLIAINQENGFDVELEIRYATTKHLIKAKLPIALSAYFNYIF